MRADRGAIAFGAHRCALRLDRRAQGSRWVPESSNWRNKKGATSVTHRAPRPRRLRVVRVGLGFRRYNENRWIAHLTGGAAYLPR